jgi:hypothetical protein
MSLELLGRIHKELTMTGSAVYETVLAVSERVNRKVQIIRLHWQASQLLERMDQVTGEVGQQITGQVSRRIMTRTSSDVAYGAVDAVLNRAVVRVRELKASLVRIDTRIRDLKLEAIHHDLLRLQRDLSVRAAAIERLVISRHAPAVGQSLGALPRLPSVQIATILRGPFLLAPAADVIFRPDDIVVLFGLRAELDQLTPWFTGSSAVPMAVLTRG